MYSQINLKLTMEEAEALKAAAKSSGKSLTRFVMEKCLVPQKELQHFEKEALRTIYPVVKPTVNPEWCDRCKRIGVASCTRCLEIET